MSFPDIRTVVLLAIITNLVCAVILVGLWLDTRKRFRGTGLFALDFVCQTMGAVLLILRGFAPDFLTIVVANSLAVAGAMLGYDGLRRFAGMRGAPRAYYGLLAVFAAIHAFFVYAQPSLESRNLNVTLWIGAICAHCAWFALRTVRDDLKPVLRGVGIVFVAFAAVNMARLVGMLVAPEEAHDFFHSGLRNALVMITYQTLLTLLAFTLVQMANRRLLNEIRLQEEKFSKAFRSSPYAIVVTRASDGTILEVNDGFTSHTGYGYDELVGRSTREIGVWCEPKDREVALAALAANGRVTGMGFPFRMKSGEIRTGLYSAEAIEINGESCVISSFGDITERLRAEEALREKNEELQRFTQALSHDLRSPLLTISAYLKLIGEDIAQRNEAKVSEDLAFLTNAADRLGHLSDELSELSRIGRIDNPPREMMLQDVVREALGLVAGRMSARGIEVHVTEEPIVLIGDHPRLVSLFLNLLDNAAKYMGDQPEPAVQVGAEDASGEIAMFVRDNGSGLEPEQVSELFAPFVRLNRSVDGSGLGLAIVKRIVDVHRGRIWVESAGVGNGATFWFTLAGTRRTTEA